MCTLIPQSFMSSRRHKDYDGTCENISLSGHSLSNFNRYECVADDGKMFSKSLGIRLVIGKMEDYDVVATR